MYRIKVPKLKDEFEDYQEWEYSVFDVGNINANDSKEARLKVEDIYGSKMCMKSKKSDIGKKNKYLIAIYPLNEQWDKMWNGVNVCSQCGQSYTKLDRDQANYFKYIKAGVCSPICETSYYEEKEDKRLQDKIELDETGIHTPVIYKITHIDSGKCYIGQTTQAFTFRWYQHFFQKSDTKFHTKLKETKVTDWIFSVIEIVEDKKILSEREQFYIDKFDSIDNGFNSVASVSNKCKKDNKPSLFEKCRAEKGE